MLQLAKVLTGHHMGGMAQANVLLSTMMGGLSASNLADCAMLCKMLVPEMIKEGYGRTFATVVTATGSLITPIIPPGIALILYGYVADVSIGKMFLAGIVPGLLCCLSLMIAIRIVAGRRGYQPVREHGPRLGEFWSALKESSAALVLIVVIIGGIRFGIFTPTEAGAIAAAFVVFVGMAVYREMTVDHIRLALLETARSTAVIMLIIMSCSTFAWILSWEEIAQDVAAFITGVSQNPIVFLLFLNVMLLIFGMFLEGNAILIVLVPLLMPTVRALGIDPIQFGIVVILNLALGTLTPPMGTVMFLACSITGTPIRSFVREMWPLFLALMVVLLLATFIPPVATFLPNL
jgi:tripartite ATP-independent transporter DctM subunit